MIEMGIVSHGSISPSRYPCTGTQEWKKTVNSPDRPDMSLQSRKSLFCVVGSYREYVCVDPWLRVTLWRLKALIDVSRGCLIWSGSDGTNLVHRGAQTRLVGTKPDKSPVPSMTNHH